MPPLYRIIEVTVYSLLNFFPLLILALYPFRQQLRFPMPVTVTLIGILTVIQVGIGTVAAFSGQHVNILSAVNTGVYAVFYFAAVKACNRRSPTATGAVVNGHSAVRRRPA